MADKTEKFDTLEQKLELFIENTRQMGIIVSDFQPQGQNVLNQKIQTMVTEMNEIDKLRTQVPDVHVPLEVFDYIDQGRNPNLYTKDCLEKALAKNEQVKGKTDSLKRFKAMLLLELSKVFPSEMEIRDVDVDMMPQLKLKTCLIVIYRTEDFKKILLCLSYAQSRLMFDESVLIRL
ncbi:mediator of RNA polymerase II transcription subunit 10, partial [Biomphalaria pfeifferi]